MKKREIDFLKVINDLNGNPRYVTHFLNLITDQDKEHIDKDPMPYLSHDLYSLAVNRAKKIGGRKFHNKRYGGGIVFQSYNVKDTAETVLKLIENVQYVKFLIDSDGGVFAYFPYDKYNEKLKNCYAHVGQHSGCHPKYAAKCKPAKRKQYKDLQKELEGIGYELEII